MELSVAKVVRLLGKVLFVALFGYFVWKVIVAIERLDQKEFEHILLKVNTY